MKIAMLYRARTRLTPAHVMLTPTLFVRVEIIDDPDAEDLSDGLDHVVERPGEEFINCVNAE